MDKGSMASTQFLSQVINKSTKWAVTGMVAGVVVWQHRNPGVLWAVSGAVLNGANAHLLKRLLNHSRPLTATGLKVDPGMPSSHAQSLGYLATYAALGIHEWNGLTHLSFFYSLLVLTTAGYLAYLRVSNGLHTPGQVVVGSGVGGLSAILMHWMWHEFVERSIVKLPWIIPSFFLVTASSFFAFAIRKWRLGDF